MRWIGYCLFSFVRERFFQNDRAIRLISPQIKIIDFQRISFEVLNKYIIRGNNVIILRKLRSCFDSLAYLHIRMFGNEN